MSEYEKLIDGVYDGAWDKNYNKTMRVRRADMPFYKYRRSRRDLCRYIDSMHVLFGALRDHHLSEHTGPLSEEEMHAAVRPITGIGLIEFEHIVDDLHECGLFNDHPKVE